MLTSLNFNFNFVSREILKLIVEGAVGRMEELKKCESVSWKDSIGQLERAEP